jgi:hypothetical protein
MAPVPGICSGPTPALTDLNYHIYYYINVGLPTSVPAGATWHPGLDPAPRFVPRRAIGS